MENKKDNRNCIIILLVAIIIILVTSIILLSTGVISFKNGGTNINDDNQSVENNINDQNNEQSEQNSNQDNTTSQNELGSNDTFTTTTNSGIVEVIGYAKVEEKVVDSMYENAGEKYNYVYFYITETKSTEFKKYLESLKGNSFVSDNAIGLGCVKNGKITYLNASDKFGEKTYELSQENVSNILNSTESKPVRLKLERLELSAGKGAPLCYSHITNVEVEN